MAELQQPVTQAEQSIGMQAVSSDVRNLPDDVAIMFFDGVCGLCNRGVDFVMKHDHARRFRFAPFQGETAREYLTDTEIANLQSLVLVMPEGTYRHSTAVVHMLLLLGGIWRVLGALLWLIPSPVRDLGYRLVAGNRYRFFAKHETCRLPTQEERAMFLP